MSTEAEVTTSGAVVLSHSGAAAVPERRDPSGATKPLTWHTPGLAKAPDWDAAAAFRKGLYTNTWVWRCANLIASTLAGLPFRVGPDPDRTSEWSPDAPLAKLLGPPPHGPTPSVSAHRLWSWSVVQYLIAGRFGWEIETAQPRGAGEVLGLYPLEASYLRPVPKYGSAEYFSGFEFGPEGDPSKVTRFVREQVLYAWRPSAENFREPESVLRAAGLDVSVAVMQDQYSAAFLRNDARPAAVVVTQPFATDEDAEAWQGQFLARHGGPANAGRLAFLEAEDDGASGASGAVDIKTIGLSQADSRFVETYEAKVRAICVAFGVPMSLLDASGRTYSNAGEEKLTFWQNTMLPLIRDLEGAVNTQLAPRLGSDVGWFDLSGVRELRPPQRLNPAQASILVDRRIVTRNEARAEFGFGPVTGGDNFEDAPVPDAGARSAPVVQIRSGAPELSSEDRRIRLWRTIDAQARTLEQVWERAMRDLFERQRKRTLGTLDGRRRSRLEAALADGEVRQDIGAFATSMWREETIKVVRGLYEQTSAMGVSRLTEKFGISFNLEQPWAAAFISERSNDLAGFVSETTYAQIRQALTDGVAAGESLDDIKARVSLVFDEASSHRAGVIARTEVISASNGATIEAARNLPSDVVAGKQWIAAIDERTRDSHLLADGQIVPMDGMFDVGGDQLSYPGDPDGDEEETIQCRCAVAMVTPEEMP